MPATLVLDQNGVDDRMSESVDRLLGEIDTDVQQQSLSSVMLRIQLR